MPGPFDDLFTQGPFSAPDAGRIGGRTSNVAPSNPGPSGGGGGQATLFINPSFADILSRPGPAPITQTPDPVAGPPALPDPGEPPQIGPSEELLSQINALQLALQDPNGFLSGLQQNLGAGALPRFGFDPRGRAGGVNAGLPRRLAPFLEPLLQQLDPSLLQIPAIAALFAPETFGLVPQGPPGRGRRPGGAQANLNPGAAANAIMALQLAGLTQPALPIPSLNIGGAPAVNPAIDQGA